MIVSNAQHEGFTTTRRSLRSDITPMRLFQKAKKLGIWDPMEFDLKQDRKDWIGHTPDERDFLLRILAQFQAGEESVTLDLLPLIHAVASDGHIEEEIFLTSFLWEEAKHVEFFRRYLDEVVQADVDLSSYHDTPCYRKIFYEELPQAMNRLLTDSSREAQAVASTTYNMIVEGVLAETGYHTFYTTLGRNNTLPGLRKALGMIQRDESRHIGYGVFLLARLIAEDPAILEVVQRRMAELQPYSVGLIAEGYAPYEGREIPFGLVPAEFEAYAMTRFQSRMAVLLRSKGKDLNQIYQFADSDFELVG